MNKYFEMRRGFLEIDGSLYEVLREIREKDDIVVDEWKTRLGAETVFRKDGHLYFVTKVQEAHIVTEEEYQAELAAKNELNVNEDVSSSSTE
jgi:hypothetical protein